MGPWEVTLNIFHPFFRGWNSFSLTLRRLGIWIQSHLADRWQVTGVGGFFFWDSSKWLKISEVDELMTLYSPRFILNQNVSYHLWVGTAIYMIYNFFLDAYIDHRYHSIVFNFILRKVCDFSCKSVKQIPTFFYLDVPRS